MTEQEDTEGTRALKSRDLLCRRTGERGSLSEHKRCPYCFGSLAEIETGRHEDFCDYHRDKDPIHFGFPPGGSRSERG